MNYKERLIKLKKRLETRRLEGLLVNKRENIYYLSGFKGDSWLIITSSNKDFIITDPRFREDAEELSGFDLILLDSPRHKIIYDIIKKYKIKALGFESNSLTLNDFLSLKKHLKKACLAPTKNLIEGLRVVKDADEIRLIKKSVAILKGAYKYAKKKIKSGLTGQSMAILIDNFMRSHGALRPAFKTIVAQNPYSSRPHAQSTDKPFCKGSCVVIDMGAVFKEYNSDLTRVLFLDRITTRFKDIYNIVKSAQHKAIEKVKPGRPISQLDRAARQHIISKGLGKYFIHNLGHGIGLEVHELPAISRKKNNILRPGMVFTIEPGIYIPGWGGLRIEDMVLVKERGFEVLTDDIPK